MKYNYNKSILLFFLFAFSSYCLNGQNAQLTITSPSNVAGDYDMQLAAFTPCEFESISGELALGEDDFGTATGCNANGDLSAISSAVSGKIALMDRGNCAFTDKVFAAQQAGAIAVIMCNNEADPPLLTMSGENDQITIPAMMLSQSDCSTIRAQISNEIELTATRRGVEDINADDEVIWGANGEGSFDGGLGDWTTEGISEADHTWSWSTDGAGMGVLFSDIVESKTGCNGAAIFDFDFLQTGGVEANLPSPPIPILVGELISPTMDLSEAEAVAVKFYQHSVPLNGTNQVATSIDGGMTWSEGIDITTENVLTASEDNRVGTEIRRIPLTGVAGESNVKIKFIANGDFYFWSIDDVEVVKLTGNNAEMVESFYTPLAYAFPQAHADADTFFFSSQVRNSGGRVLDNVRLSVEVIQDATGTVVHEDQGTESNVPIGEIVSVATDNLWVPVGLDVGTYTMNYTLSVLDAAETNTNDNTSTRIFEITDNTFAKEPGPTNAFRPVGEGSWAAVAMYRMSNNVTDYVATNAVIAIASPEDNLTNNLVDVSIARLDDGMLESNFDGFDFNEADLQGHPDLTLISTSSHVFTTEENFDLVTVPFSSSGVPIPLDPGATYMVFVQFNDNDTGGPIPNNELSLAWNTEERLQDGFQFVINSDGWGQFSDQPAPVIRMQVEFMSDTDDTPLPVGSFSAYPNPANNVLNVELDLEDVSDATIIMASLDGKIIEVKELKNVSKRSLDFDVSQLPAGTYILKAYTETGSTTHKIVVAK